MCVRAYIAGVEQPGPPQSNFSSLTIFLCNPSLLQRTNENPSDWPYLLVPLSIPCRMVELLSCGFAVARRYTTKRKSGRLNGAADISKPAATQIDNAAVGFQKTA